MNLHKENNTRIIAVFCELRKGLEKHHLLNKAEYVGDFLSKPEYQLISVDGNSKVGLKFGSSSVIFEVYKVSALIMENINKLKGYEHAGCKDNVNDKKVIKTPYGQAITYINKYSHITDLNIIRDYDYADYHNYKLRK